MKITEKETKNNTVLLHVAVTQPEVDETKEEVVDEMIKNVTVKGFRQGKAPRSIAEKNLDPNKLSNHILTHVLNHAVSEALKDNKYQLLGRPVLDKLEPAKDGGWDVYILVPLYPEIKLGKYKEALKKITKKDDNLEEVYQTLLKNIKIDVPKVIVDQETDHSWKRLEDQAKSLNLTVAKYLEAIKKTEKEVRQEYAEKATESITLDLILLEIAKEQKIETTNQEIYQMTQTKHLPEDQLRQLVNMVNRRKTIDFIKEI